MLKVSAQPAAAGALEIRNLTVKLKKQSIFENLSFRVPPGQILGITGRNGAGKTTLMRCIAGLQKEAAGQILLDGRPLNRKMRSRLSYMIMQDVNHQLFWDSVWNECLLSCGSQTPQGRICDALEEYGLLAQKEHHPMALSGGQKQRLAIVTGIIAEKRILLFDEPSSGLDYVHMKTVGNTLRALAASGHIVLVVSHDTELLNSSCDRACPMLL